MKRLSLYAPVVEVIIREREEILLYHVTVGHGLVNARLLGGNGLWNCLDIFSLFSKVLTGVGSLSQLVGNLFKVTTNLKGYKSTRVTVYWSMEIQMH